MIPSTGIPPKYTYQIKPTDTESPLSAGKVLAVSAESIIGERVVTSSEDPCKVGVIREAAVEVVQAAATYKTAARRMLQP